MTPEQWKIRDAAIAAAWEYGYSKTLAAPLGKFEGEPFYVLHYYDEVLNGSADDPLYDGDTVAADISDCVRTTSVQRSALPPTRRSWRFWYSDSGFVHLDELTAKQYDELRDAYSAGEES